MIELRVSVRQPIDWDYLIVSPTPTDCCRCCTNIITTAAIDLVPAHFLSRLKRDSVSNSQNVLHLIGKQLRVYKLFKENSIPVALFKGPLLAHMAYGEISLRQAGDIDLLIARRDFAQVRRLLESLGYEMTPRLTPAQLASHLTNHCEIQFMRDEWFTVVDLHWDLAPRSFVFGLKADEVMSRLQSVSLAGTTVETFGAEDLLLYQAMHGAKHLWRRLEWISCLAESLRATTAINWDTLVDRAAKAHATRILALGLRLVEEFSDVPVPAHVLDLSRSGQSDATNGDANSRRSFSPPLAQPIRPKPTSTISASWTANAMRSSQRCARSLSRLCPTGNHSRCPHRCTRSTTRIAHCDFQKFTARRSGGGSDASGARDV